MTVEELLQLPTIKGLKLISGNLGVHREISTVTVVDTPDGFQWLKGNEVVITTTYAIASTGLFSVTSFPRIRIFPLVGCSNP